MRDENGIAEDSVFAVGSSDGDVAVAECLARNDVLLEDIEVDERTAGGGLVSGCDASWG